MMPYKTERWIKFSLFVHLFLYIFILILSGFVSHFFSLSVLSYKIIDDFLLLKKFIKICFTKIENIVKNLTNIEKKFQVPKEKSKKWKPTKTKVRVLLP